MNALRSIALALAFASGPSAAPAQTPAPPSPAPAALSIVGQLLSFGPAYVAFTTGDALQLAPGFSVPARLRLGQTIRVSLDPQTHAVTAIASAAGPLPGDIEAAKVPREFVVASTASKRTVAAAGGETGAAAHAVTVTINVRVPDNTPVSDDVYLATDRTNFSPAEIRMIRIDARTWNVSVQIASGSVLRYEFTRGNFANIERDKLGSIVNPRTLTAADALQTHDAVAHWADIN